MRVCQSQSVLKFGKGIVTISMHFLDHMSFVSWIGVENWKLVD